GTTALDVKAAGRLSGECDLDVQVIAGESRVYAVGPLDQADAVAAQILFHSQGGKLGSAAQPVGIEMVDRQPGIVLLDQDEGGTAHGPAVGDVKALGDGADQMRLAGAKRADQGDDGTRKE